MAFSSADGFYFLIKPNRNQLNINNCSKEGELDKVVTVKEYLTVQKEGKQQLVQKLHKLEKSV